MPGWIVEFFDLTGKISLILFASITLAAWGFLRVSGHSHLFSLACGMLAGAAVVVLGLVRLFG